MFHSTQKEYLKPVVKARNISTSHWHYNCDLISVVVKCMGPANGISRNPCQRSAPWTTAGPGPVDASGWGLTWKWDPAEGWTQGKRMHTRRRLLLLWLIHRITSWKCIVDRSWAQRWLKPHSLLWLHQRKKRRSFPLSRHSKQPVRMKKAPSCQQMSECCVPDLIMHTHTYSKTTKTIQCSVI